MGQKLGSKILLGDLAGKGVEPAATYLERALLIEIKYDPAWSLLRELQALRNIIAHSGGKRLARAPSCAGPLGAVPRMVRHMPEEPVICS